MASWALCRCVRHPLVAHAASGPRERTLPPACNSRQPRPFRLVAASKHSRYGITHSATPRRILTYVRSSRGFVSSHSKCTSSAQCTLSPPQIYLDSSVPSTQAWTYVAWCVPPRLFDPHSSVRLPHLSSRADMDSVRMYDCAVSNSARSELP
ncbi:hypothetical protein HYPSUDRAFT_467195 [Hypholoma sublateritium FD-334 SS-4]|uniref:Uncharacterized protein n=1 Tax=Hypholoma sublateritium (strain FD-334 SS-4) TaxID=945553 RepID=A0A0D2NZZ9_HYPSF|nr:hypothetical protein HYPSUDRAFT_467195 [Hypholoma sublateritium FD-334 SS-4]